MIKFSQFLIEGRDAPLYHGTSIMNLPHILGLGYLKPAKGDPLSDDTVAMTRSSRYAAAWSAGKEKVEREILAREDGMPATRTKNKVVIEIDQRALAMTHKIEPFDYFMSYPFPNPIHRRRESEERTFKQIPVKYFKAIHYSGRPQDFAKAINVWDYEFMPKTFPLFKHLFVFNSPVAKRAQSEYF